MTGARRAVAVAAIALACAAAWMALNVVALYHGNLTGLFLTGATAPVPPALDSGHTYRTKDLKGYDGQFYHFIAHDPLIRREFLDFVDNPRLRWRRIGLPGLAAVLALGSDSFVDWTYVAIELAFLFLGTYWLSRYAMALDLPAALGLAFLAIPAVAVSVDRMTVDLPLAALCVGLAVVEPKVGEHKGRSWIVPLILCGAALFRETGMLVIAAWGLSRFFQRDWRGAGMAIAAGAPAAAWWIYVARNTPVDGTAWLSSYPFSGLIERTLRGTGEPASTLWLRAADALENLSLAGMWLALAIAFYLLWKRRSGWLEITAVLFAVFAAALGKFDLWSSAYATGRTMSPLLIALGLLALRDQRPVFAVPLALILPRIVLQYEAQLGAVVKGVS